MIRSPGSSPVRQKTIKTAIACTGIGLHSGERVRMALRPAEAGTGIVFRRTDVGVDAADIRALWSNVVDTRLCTAIGNRAGTRVATIEHLMAALAGAEIDNLVVELDAAEVPVMDGSAAPFVFLVECAGVVEQDAPRRAIQVLAPVAVGDADRRASLAPAAGFSVDFSIDFESPVIARQRRAVELEPWSFRQEVARARTFGFAHEVAALRKAGLARGGSLENSVVIDGDRVVNEDGLRYEDEFVRHKILDCVGDLYLAGAPLLARVGAERSGHRLNNQLLRALFARRDAWRTVDLSDVAAAPAAARRPRLVSAGD
jgi:UDP-3-O-[3-hydroxymyristoyl] N-acetylglucosamine deacetylase